jgi:hypothetical protein
VAVFIYPGLNQIIFFQRVERAIAAGNDDLVTHSDTQIANVGRNKTPGKKITTHRLKLG